MGRLPHRQDLPQHQSRQLRRHRRRIPVLRRRGHRRRRPRRRRSLEDLASHPRSQARRNHLQNRRATHPAQRAIRPRHDPRDGQGPRRNPRRRAGGHRHRLLHGRRGPPPLRPDHPVRTAQQIRHVRPHARRRLRHDRPVELPHGHPVLEIVSGARLRQHLRHQARRGHAALHLQPRPDPHRRRPSRRESSTSSPASDPTPERRSSRIPASAPSPSPDPPRSAASSDRPPPPTSSPARSRWAARTP